MLLSNTDSSSRCIYLAHIYILRYCKYCVLAISFLHLETKIQCSGIMRSVYCYARQHDNASRVLAVIYASVCPGSVCHFLEPYQNGASQDYNIFTMSCRKNSSSL